MLIERRGRYEPQLEIEGLRPCRVHPRRELRSLLVRRLGRRCGSRRRATLRGRDRLRRADPACGRATCCASLRYIVRGKGQLDADDIVSGHDLDRIVVRCDRPLPLQADGEDLGDVTEATFEARRDAVSVLV